MRKLRGLLVIPLLACGFAARAPATTVPAVGYVGCSNTYMEVGGYHADGGQALWASNSAYSTGTVIRWATDPSPLWDAFDQMEAARPTATVWWNLCIHLPETDADSYTAALTDISIMQAKIPGVVIYASALQPYVAPHVCSACGADGPARAQTLVDRLVSEGRVLAGPTLPALRGPDSAGTGKNELQSDGCHPNNLGQTIEGQTLLSFFG